jgi:hypothetical protein
MALRSLAGACFVIAKGEVEPSQLLTLVLFFVRAVQMISFVISDRVGAPWAPAVAGASSAASFFTLDFLDSYIIWTLYAVLFALALAWAAALPALFAYAWASFARDSFGHLWPLHALRLMGGLTASILYIPTLRMLLVAGFL